MFLNFVIPFILPEFSSFVLLAILILLGYACMWFLQIFINNVLVCNSILFFLNNRRKKSKVAATDNCLVVPEDDQTNVHAEDNGNLHHGGVLPKKRVKKDKSSKLPGERDKSSALGSNEKRNDTTKSTPNVKRYLCSLYIFSSSWWYRSPGVWSQCSAAKLCIHLCICMFACISIACSVLNYSLSLSLYLTNSLFFLSHFCLADSASFKKMAMKVSMYPMSLAKLKRFLIYTIVWFRSVVYIYIFNIFNVWGQILYIVVISVIF